MRRIHTPRPSRAQRAAAAQDPNKIITTGKVTSNDKRSSLVRSLFLSGADVAVAVFHVALFILFLRCFTSPSSLLSLIALVLSVSGLNLYCVQLFSPLVYYSDIMVPLV